MDRTGAVFADCGNMSRRSIALMTGKTVFRVDFIVLTHHPVPGYFGKDAGGCDGTLRGSAGMDGTDCLVWMCPGTDAVGAGNTDAAEKRSQE